MTQTTTQIFQTSHVWGTEWLANDGQAADQIKQISLSGVWRMIDST